MARLSFEELDEIKEKYGVDRLWSWSRVDSFKTSKYEHFLKYILHKKEDNDNCAYAPIGSLAHDCLERYYNGEISHDEMLTEFDDGWITNIDIADLKFDRNDESKNESIKMKYRYDIRHFLKNHEPMAGKVYTERFVTAKIGDNVLQGYIDAMYKTDDDVWNIIDFKTSSKFGKNALEGKSGQLTVYAIAIMQRGIPIERIRIGFNMLKYCSVQYLQKNGAVKTREVERYKLGESLQTNCRMWLKDAGCSEDDTDEYLKALLDANDISVLPESVRDKYVVGDCMVWVPLTQELVDKWTSDIILTISQILSLEDEYKKTHDEYLWWDDDEHVKKESFYFATLCGYSANLMKPYAKYLDSLESSKNNTDFFGVSNTVSISKDGDSDDLSWLDELM